MSLHHGLLSGLHVRVSHGDHIIREFLIGAFWPPTDSMEICLPSELLLVPDIRHLLLLRLQIFDSLHLKPSLQLQFLVYAIAIPLC